MLERVLWQFCLKAKSQQARLATLEEQSTEFVHNSEAAPCESFHHRLSL
jgi:hypothetical protein